jgi:gliding motility-associated-like protein
VTAAAFNNIENGSTFFRQMAIDPARNIYIGGSTFGIVDFDPGPTVFPHEGIGPLVLKLGPCFNPTNSTLTINSCQAYTLNNQTYDSSGTYYQTILNSTGCDSLITLNLTIHKKFTEQHKAICEGEFFFSGGANHSISGIYIDSLKTTGGCDSIIKTHLTVNPNPLPNLGADKVLCRNTQVNLTPGTFSSYQWQDNSTSNTFSAFNRAGLYWVKVTNSFNCMAIDTLEVTSIIDPPSNFLKNNDSICSYESIQLTATGSYSSYQWSSGELTRNIQVQQPGSYWLTVTDAYGCRGVDSTMVFTKQCMYGVYVPNAFTPDKNGLNDQFKPLVFGKLVQYKLLVYSRWGSIVFQTSDPKNGWDGTLNGKPQNPATFVWKCTYQFEGEKEKMEHGSVMLIR